MAEPHAAGGAGCAAAGMMERLGAPLGAAAMNERTARMQPARPPAFPPAFPPPPARPPDRRTSVRRQQARVRRPPAQGRRLRPALTQLGRRDRP